VTSRAFGCVLVVLAALGLGASAGGAAMPRLTDPHPCAEAAGFTCSTLAVPLDRGGRVPGILRLNVAVANDGRSSRGVLLFLTGGPGQPGVPAIPRISLRLAPVLNAYRLVMVDQRGTGGTAIDCPQLQAQVGTSDIAAPTAAAVRDCASRLGHTRGLYSTGETVADLEALRRALGVSRWTLDGVSYGTYTAERYAVGHPRAVKALVLDSVVPHVDPQVDEALYLVGFQATARVLRASCAQLHCGYDPAEDINWLVQHGVDGVKLFDAIVTYEFVDPSYADLLAMIHTARLGGLADLNLLIDQMHRGGAAPANLFSSGLHAATLCADFRFPWGAATSLPTRRALLERRVRQLPERAVWPFDRATAARNGFISTCLDWPATPSARRPPDDSKLPAVPTLLLNGDHDLSTPLEWAREEARRAPGGKLVVVRGASHSVQSRERGETGRKAVEAFLLGQETR
jgi:pimeloyl-ACP methyl ester carboxylesterase